METKPCRFCNSNIKIDSFICPTCTTRQIDFEDKEKIKKYYGHQMLPWILKQPEGLFYFILFGVIFFCIVTEQNENIFLKSIIFAFAIGAFIFWYKDFLVKKRINNLGVEDIANLIIYHKPKYIFFQTNNVEKIFFWGVWTFAFLNAIIIIGSLTKPTVNEVLDFAKSTNNLKNVIYIEHQNKFMYNSVDVKIDNITKTFYGSWNNIYEAEDKANLHNNELK